MGDYPDGWTDGTIACKIACGTYPGITDPDLMSGWNVKSASGKVDEVTCKSCRRTMLFKQGVEVLREKVGELQRKLALAVGELDMAVGELNEASERLATFSG
jgi:hypothetical protein